MTEHRPLDLKHFLLGGAMLVLIVVLMDLQKRIQPPSTLVKQTCKEVIQSQSELSRDELSQLLNITEGMSREEVRSLVQEPYCILPTQSDQEGGSMEQEAYPLAFDPQTWLVIRYQNQKYNGYSFTFR
jgi:hypothetical protein